MSDTITLLSASTYSNSATLQGEKAKGDAYFGANDGLHTIAIQLNDFIGTIKIDGLDITKMGLHELRTKLAIIPQGKCDLILVKILMKMKLFMLQILCYFLVHYGSI